MERVSRRGLLRGSGLAVAGAALGAVGVVEVPRLFGWDHPPLSGGYAAAADNQAAVGSSSVHVRYFVKSWRPVVALTFDDGPAPRYTPRFLDVLDELGVPATFFMVGRNVLEYAGLVKNRLGRHEVGNHSWEHRDLATMNLPAIQDDLRRTHAVIQNKLGRTPVLFRPPFGHFGGSTVLAADSFGYDLILWDRQMHERRFKDDPAAQAKDIVDTVRPGSIVLAHDAGDKRRLTTLDALHDMVTGLIARGYEFVTVSDLIARSPVPVP
ncbi:polysaccharide deacetylase family protein [Actinoplanes solisilvae]|uniref:polysaccharide deacetylase family protein n=1 Tax=Actinoplanes solisilvae TaxID=2486853 RepID=UPI000FDA1B26|nr:polysaccharide deacetylase family protein [Actinoplanes solisilvae]